MHDDSVPHAEVLGGDGGSKTKNKTDNRDGENVQNQRRHMPFFKSHWDLIRGQRRNNKVSYDIVRLNLFLSVHSLYLRKN